MTHPETFFGKSAMQNILFNSMLTQRKVPLVSLFLPTSKTLKANLYPGSW